MKLRTLAQANVEGKKVLLRSELNVPQKNGKITDDTRIKKSLPTIKYLLEKNAKIIICAHLGRPDGKIVEDLRLNLVAKRLSELLGKEVKKMNNIVGEDEKKMAQSLKNGEIMLLENIRFDPREEQCNHSFSADLAMLANIFVSDAFGALHRKHCSVCGVSNYLPSYAGLLVEQEVRILSQVLDTPQDPLVIIVGGAKMKTKVGVIENFLDKADKIIIGGGISNTFLAAQGINIGDSLFEKEEFETVIRILKKDINKKIYIPIDVRVAENLSQDTKARNVKLKDMNPSEKIFDIGNQSIEDIKIILEKAGTIVWNGPVGVFEYAPFSNGTRSITEMLAKSKADTIIGGGDTAEAIFSFGFIEDDFTFVSTGGGASLKFLEGSELPGVKVLISS